jgi:hypothetical protein
LSFPYFNGLGDVANSGPGSTNKCVGDAGPPAGPAAGDGIINADDAICDLWTSRLGSFEFRKYDRDTCSYAPRVGIKAPLGTTFQGAYTSALERDIGYEVVVTVPTGSTLNPQNRGVIVGSHDPSFTGRPIIAAACTGTAARLDIQNLVFHTMYQVSDELLCGLEGVDWQDVNPPVGSPDTCLPGTDPANAGIPYDGLHALTVQWYDDSTHGTLSRTVRPGFGAGSPPTFLGTNFPLRPGDAYIFQIDPAHVRTTFLSPHF